MGFGTPSQMPQNLAHVMENQWTSKKISRPWCPPRGNWGASGLNAERNQKQIKTQMGFGTPSQNPTNVKENKWKAKKMTGLWCRRGLGDPQAQTLNYINNLTNKQMGFGTSFQMPQDPTNIKENQSKSQKMTGFWRPPRGTLGPSGSKSKLNGQLN